MSTPSSPLVSAPAPSGTRGPDGVSTERPAIQVGSVVTGDGAGSDRLLRTIGRIAEFVLTSPSWERRIEYCMEGLGEATGVSRVYIFENHVADDGALLTSQRYEWVAPGVAAASPDGELENVTFDPAFRRWAAALRVGGVIQGHVREFPACELEFLLAQEIRSLLVVPIFAGSQWWGLMGFDQCDRERVWSPDEVEALGTAAEILGGAIRHERTAGALQQSEERYRRLVEQSPDAIAVHDGGVIRYVNTAALRLLREDRPDLVVGRSIFDFIDASDHARVLCHLSGDEHAGDRKPAELCVVRADGTRVPVEATVVRVPFDGAAASQLVIRDIALRKRAEADARELIREQAARAAAEASERRARFLADAGTMLASSLDYRTTLRSVARLAISSLADSCVIYILDGTGRVQRLEVAHADPEQEKVLWEILAHDPPDPAAPRSPLARVLRSGEAEVLPEIEATWFLVPGHEAEHLERCRRVMPRSLMCVPLIMRGQVGGAISFGSSAPGRTYGDEDLALARELAARAALAVDNARLYFEAQQANQAKSEFMAVMSHELKTPLTAVTTYAELLRSGLSGEMTEAQQKQVEVIADNSFHLAQLIDEVLSYTRTESGRVEVCRELIDMAETAKGLLEWVRPAADAKGLALGLVVHAPAGTAVVNTDATRLKQILVNLLTNAVRFTDEGRIDVTVELDDVPEGERVWVRVADTGIGIAPEHHAQIWEPFWQVDRSLTRRVNGTGLGLSIVKRLTRLLGGGVTLHSTPDEGSTFGVWLPRHPR